MGIAIVIFLIILVVMFIKTSGVLIDSQINSLKLERIEEIIKNYELDGFVSQRFFSGKNLVSAVAFNHDSRQALLINTEEIRDPKKPVKVDSLLYRSRVIPYNAIVGSEFKENGHSITHTDRTSQLAGAAIGGLAFGGVGAIIGGLSGKQKNNNSNSTVNSMAVNLFINDLHKPIFTIDFVSENVGGTAKSAIKVESPEFRHIEKESKECYAVVNGILRVLEGDKNAVDVSNISFKEEIFDITPALVKEIKYKKKKLK